MTGSVAGGVIAQATSLGVPFLLRGGFLAPKIRELFRLRTTALIIGTVLILLWVVTSFWLALILLVGWGMLFAAAMPIRQAYLNGLIPSQQRATVLSFDSLVGNTGGVVIQPGLGKAADVWSYGTSLAIDNRWTD